MKRILVPLTIISAVPVASAALLPAEIAATSDFTFASEYVFRGIQFGDRSLQPSLEAEIGQFYAGTWANLPIEGDYDAELNYYGGLTFAAPNIPVELDAGVTVYHFPDTSSRRSHEFYLGASVDDVLIPGLGLSGYYFFDIDYYTHVGEASLGYEWDTGIADTTLAASIHGGVQGQGKDKAESYNYYGASLEAAYPLTGASSITAGIHYATAEKYTFDTAAGERGKNLFWTLSFTGSY